MTPPSSVLLLPGLLCDDAVWADVVPLLDGAAVTMVSYGALDSIQAMARHALTLAPDGPLTVVGHSMGGRVALEILRSAPQRVQRLCLMDTGIDPLPLGSAGEAERAQRLALLALARRDGMRAMGREWARGMVHPQRLSSPLFVDILDMIERKTPQILEAQITALLQRPDARPLLPCISCPTTILCGREDTWSPLARHVEMRALMRGSTLVVVEHCGHMSTMERPAAVAAALRTLLQASPTSVVPHADR
jgi:pimeloyl-ACP methyl ester carboxylesterase